MKFYDKLIALRREKGFSQEQLAELLGVSRQAVSKWESGQTLPEMEKLIALADFFGVSIDYLVRDNVARREEDKTVVTTQDNTAVMEQLVEIQKSLHEPRGRWAYHYEYKSKAHLGKLPLVHIHMQNGGLVVAKGVIAVGNVAVGGIAVGGFSLGVLSLGGIGAGLLSLGGLALGGVALGGVAVGAVALGGVALGAFYALGAVAVGGELAVGAAASGRVAAGVAAKGEHILLLPEGGPTDTAAVRAFVLEHAHLPGFVRALLAVHQG